MHKDKKGRRQTVAILLALLLLATGCNNPKDALHLEATTLMARIPQGVPVRVRLTFTASEGRICIPKPYANALDCELVRDKADAPLGRAKVARCGTHYLLLVPLNPIFLAGCLMDVGDVLGRFAVLTPEHPSAQHFLVIANGDQYYLMSEQSREYCDWGKDAPPLPPGRYRLKVTYQADKVYGGPAPFFWDVYEQPVSSETAFEVVAAE